MIGNDPKVFDEVSGQSVVVCRNERNEGKRLGRIATFVAGIWSLVVPCFWLWVHGNVHEQTPSLMNYGAAVFLGILAWGLASVSYGLDAYRGSSVTEAFGRATIGYATALGILSLLQVMFGVQVLPRSLLLGAGFPLISGMATLRFFVLCFARRKHENCRILFLGSSAVAEDMRAQFASMSDPRLENFSFIDTDLFVHDNAKIIARYLLMEMPSLVIIDEGVLGDSKLLHAIVMVNMSGVAVRMAADVYEKVFCKITQSSLSYQWFLLDICEIHKRIFRVQKRVVDFLFGFLGTCVFLLLYLPLGLLVKLDSSGPVLYQQWRIGAGGERFLLWKFRSMYVEDVQEQRVWKPGDSRVTRVGKFLRLSHIDELPQFLNLLRGEMSLVGPRPEQPQFVEDLTEKIPFYNMRHMVRPGITGWAQITAPYAHDLKTNVAKFERDLWYIKYQTIFLDFRIVVRTFARIFGIVTDDYVATMSLDNVVDTSANSQHILRDISV